MPGKHDPDHIILWCADKSKKVTTLTPYLLDVSMAWKVYLLHM